MLFSLKYSATETTRNSSCLASEEACCLDQHPTYRQQMGGRGKSMGCTKELPAKGSDAFSLLTTTCFLRDHLILTSIGKERQRVCPSEFTSDYAFHYQACTSRPRARMQHLYYVWSLLWLCQRQDFPGILTNEDSLEVFLCMLLKTLL